MNKFYIARCNGKTSSLINAIAEMLSIPAICTKQYKDNRILQIAEEYGMQPAVLNTIIDYHKIF